MIPHICPVCCGRGEVPRGFYGLYRMNETVCHSCHGTGIVWEQHDKPYVVPPTFTYMTTTA